MDTTDDRVRRMLLNLYRKGPALPVELAARFYSFPDEIMPQLRELEEAGLIEMTPIARSRVGGALVYLSEQGRRITYRFLRAEV
jgi:DNA-binding MarR family transcriptional regulator